MEKLHINLIIIIIINEKQVDTSGCDLSRRIHHLSNIWTKSAKLESNHKEMSNISQRKNNSILLGEESGNNTEGQTETRKENIIVFFKMVNHKRSEKTEMTLQSKEATKTQMKCRRVKHLHTNGSGKNTLSSRGHMCTQIIKWT